MRRIPTGSPRPYQISRYINIIESCRCFKRIYYAVHKVFIWYLIHPTLKSLVCSIVGSPNPLLPRLVRARVDTNI